MILGIYLIILNATIINSQKRREQAWINLSILPLKAAKLSIPAIEYTNSI